MATRPFTTGSPPEWPTPPARPSLPSTPGTPVPHWVERHDARDDWLQQRLFENRIVLLHGIVDREAATRLTGQLLALDAAAQRPIRLHIDSPSADLTAALLLADTLDLLRVTTYGLVIGEVGGGTLAVLMATDHRAAYPHARLRLSEPRAEVAPFLGDTREAARHQEQLLADFVARLARATGKSTAVVRADLRTGRYLSAVDAVTYGLVESVATPESTALGVR